MLWCNMSAEKVKYVTLQRPYYVKVWKGTASIKPLHSSMKVKTGEVPKIIPFSKWAGATLSSRHAVFLQLYSVVFCFCGTWNFIVMVCDMPLSPKQTNPLYRFTTNFPNISVKFQLLLPQNQFLPSNNIR